MIRRIAVALIAVVVALMASPAWAGPSDKQPAQVNLKLSEARHYAHVGAEYMARGFVGPQKPRVGKCATDDTLGRRLWKCPVEVGGSDTRCTMVVWVWGARDASRWYEYHQLRCTAH